MTIIPVPPGYAVALQRPQTRRFAEPNVANQFIVGQFDRGLVGQARNPADLAAKTGGRVAYSNAYDEAVTALSEAGPGVACTYSRVIGPDAEAATITLNDDAGTPAPSITVTAANAGQWGNNLEVEVEEVEADVSVRLVITESDTTVAVSPTVTTLDELVEWSAQEVLDGTAVVTVTAVGTLLPAVAAAAALTGGDDDRGNITDQEWIDAIERLDPRYGPGVVRISGSFDEQVHGALLTHCNVNGRRAFLDQPDDVTENEAVTHSLALESDNPDTCRHGLLFASWGDAEAITGEANRTVPYSAVFSGIQSRVLQQLGIGAPAFGEVRGRSRTLRRLRRDWTSRIDPDNPGEVQRLYAEHINVPVDRGDTINLEGLRTLDRDSRLEDGNVAITSMWLQFEGSKIARRYLGEPIDQITLVKYEADLDGLCQRLLDARAIVSLPDPDTGGDDGGRIVNVAEFNTPETMQARELHGFVRIRPAGSIHWVDLLVGTAGYTDRLGI